MGKVGIACPVGQVLSVANEDLSIRDIQEHGRAVHSLEIPEDEARKAIAEAKSAS